MDQNLQFFITVGTVIAVFLWLRNDINRLDGEITSLRTEVRSVRNEVTNIRESIAWVRGRMVYSEPVISEKEQ